MPVTVSLRLNQKHASLQLSLGGRAEAPPVAELALKGTNRLTD